MHVLEVQFLYIFMSPLGEGGEEEADGGGGGEGGVGALLWHHPQGCRQNPDRKVKGPKLQKIISFAQGKRENR